jgi:hypothetical protein
MINAQDQLKTRYSFGDFLFYTCLLTVPVFTAILAIFKHSLFWAIAFAVFAAAMTGLILKFYCTRCPHYAREDKTLECIFFWRFPKFFNPRPGSLNTVDKIVAFGAPAAVLLFPLFWLFKEPGLLFVYILSLSGFSAGIYRNECKRCIYFECPMNKIPEAIKNQYPTK